MKDWKGRDTLCWGDSPVCYCLHRLIHFVEERILHTPKFTIKALIHQDVSALELEKGSERRRRYNTWAVVGLRTDVEGRRRFHTVSHVVRDCRCSRRPGSGFCKLRSPFEFADIKLRLRIIQLLYMHTYYVDLQAAPSP